MSLLFTGYLVCLILPRCGLGIFLRPSTPQPHPPPCRDQKGNLIDALFSLPKNVTKSAVRNFLSAFGAPGEFIISLLLPGGLSYLFKIRFLVFFPLLPSYALGVVVQDIFQAILYVDEAFAAFLRSSS